MYNLLNIIGKNFKILIRSKLSALIILLAPLLIVFLVGMAFNSSELYRINVGTYSPSENELTNSILTSFEEKSFSIQKLDSEELCINSVKEGKTQICIIFPEGLSIEGSTEPVTFHADKSRVNLAYSLINDINSQISSKSSELSVTMTQALIDVVDEAKTNLIPKTESISSAISNTEAIESKSDTISSSIPSVSALISSLEEAKNITAELSCANQTLVDDLEEQIDSVLIDLTNLEGSTAAITQIATEIKSKSTSTKTTLSDLQNSLNALSELLNDVKVTEAEKVVSPIKTEVQSITSDSSNLNYLFPTLLALIILLASIILSSTMVLRERKTKAFFRNFMTPTSDFVFLLGTYITCLLILLIQLAILLAAAIFWLKMPILSVLGSTALILFISATVFIFLGMAIGYAFKSEETALLAAIGIAALLMFFSNTILPIETITEKFKYIALFNPLVVSNSILKKMILFKASLGSVLPELYILLIALVVFFIFTFVAREFTKRRA
ncbi:MAG: ABC transporter permease [Nanoarchaeota archaeon]